MNAISAELFEIAAREERRKQDNREVRKAHKMESGLVRKGYRWVKVGNNTKILVPFKKGKPTQEAEQRVLFMKRHLGII